MKFTLDSKEMFSHLILSNRKIAIAMGKSNAWVEDGTLEVKLTCNGIEIPASELDALLNKLWKQAQIETGAAAFEEAVRVEAEKRLKSAFSKELEALTSLSSKMEDLDQILCYPWDK